MTDPVRPLPSNGESTPLWLDPTWLATETSVEEEEAFNELQARLDRESEWGGAAHPERQPESLSAGKSEDPQGVRTGALAGTPSAAARTASRPETFPPARDCGHSTGRAGLPPSSAHPASGGSPPSPPEATIFLPESEAA